MWIIRLALNRPYTFVVAALLLLLVTPFVLIKTPTDIFPSINIPVISIIWSYNGLSAREIEQRIIYTQERALTTTVNNIEHIESTSYDSIGIIKLYFQPGVTISTAVAQVTAVSQTIQDNFRPARRHPSLFSTTPQPSRFCNTALAAPRFPNNRLSISRSIRFASVWSVCRAS